MFQINSLPHTELPLSYRPPTGDLSISTPASLPHSRSTPLPRLQLPFSSIVTTNPHRSDLPIEIRRPISPSMTNSTPLLGAHTHQSDGSMRSTRIRGPRRYREWIALVVGGAVIFLVLYAGLRIWAGDGQELSNLSFDGALALSITDATAPADRRVKKIWATSHNDEMQGQDALQLALSLGYGYIEVDTHLGPATSTTPSPSSKHPARGKKGSHLDPSLTLLAGHTEKDLHPERTLKKLYFDPLMTLLDANNAAVNSSGGEQRSWVGIYKDDPCAEVVLMIDMKNDGGAIWPYLVVALRPFLDKGYLTAYNVSTSTYTQGPLTIVGTGSTPVPQVYYSSFRYIFYDAPLLQLSEPYTIPATSFGPSITFNWDKTISPIASDKYPLLSYLALGPGQDRGGQNPYMCNLKLYSAIAREKGIQSRWWGVARQPQWLRKRMWEIVWKSGVGVMNGDDLEEMKVWLETKDEREREHIGC